jgi:small subunit ribosomal protein S2
MTDAADTTTWIDSLMSQPTIEQLLEAGVHFGHQTRRWNPKMRRFIFAERNGIHIIDLQKTLKQLEIAQKLARDVVMRGEQVLFVCTKQQLGSIVAQEAERSGSMHVTERWLGGLLTNFGTVKKQLKKLKELEAGTEEGGGFSNYTKKEQLLMARQRDKLAKNLSGIKSMTRIPGLMFVVDAKKERIAVSEANKLGIPIIAIADTNADPDLISVPVAGNDDAIRSVELLTKALANTIAEARREAPTRPVEEDTEESTYSSDRGMESAGRDERGRGGRGGQGGGPGGQGGQRRRRRANPGAIAARLRGPEADAAAPEPAAEDA